MESYTQKRFGKNHIHRYFVEYGSGEAKCECGKEQGGPRATKGQYHSMSCRYGDILYDSIFEANYARSLDWRLKATDKSRIKDWKRQVPLRVMYKGDTLCTLWVDFVVEHFDGTFELCETKGYETEIFKMKLRLLEAIWLPDHPEYRYTLIK